MEKQWKKFLALIGEVRDLAAVLELLEWDMQVNLPENAAAGRGSQIETPLRNSPRKSDLESPRESARHA